LTIAVPIDKEHAMSVRLSVSMNPEVADALKHIADKRGINATEATRRAIAWYKFFTDAQDEQKKVQLVDPKTGKVSEIVMLA